METETARGLYENRLMVVYCGLPQNGGQSHVGERFIFIIFCRIMFSSIVQSRRPFRQSHFYVGTHVGRYCASGRQRKLGFPCMAGTQATARTKIGDCTSVHAVRRGKTTKAN